jgi:biotin transport system substrate-specific component
MHTIALSTHQKEHSSLNTAFVVLVSSWLLALSAQIAIPLGFTLVPMYFTVQLILFLSVFLGKKGAYATWAYLAQGALGLPFFTHAGSGIAHFFGPTGGYLIGFALAAYLVAHFSEKMEKRPSSIFALLLVGNALIWGCGTAHLSLMLGWKNALMLGLYPFIAGDLFKLLLTMKGLKTLKFFQ